jgi:lysophospholipid acyltransferase (LPLAT)-like uncharacterized protein
VNEMPLLKRLIKTRWLNKAIAVILAKYLQLVWKTSRVVFEPQDFKARALASAPIIIGMWHGQHFLTPFLADRHPTKALISRHRDGEINAMIAEHLGIQSIRGSGGHRRKVQRKGGVSAFYEMLDALKKNSSVALTADVPKISRIAGRGIANLALISGRPVFVVAIATRNRLVFRSWDRAALNLPFGRAAVVGAGPISISLPAAAPEEFAEFTIEIFRRSIETALNRVTERAYEIVDTPV